MQFNLLFKYPVHPIHIRLNLLFKYPIHMKQKKTMKGTSLVTQWLRICPARQGTCVWSPVGELRSHKPWSNWARVSQLLKLCTTRKDPCNATKIPDAAPKTQHNQVNKWYRKERTEGGRAPRGFLKKHLKNKTTKKSTFYINRK